MDINLIRTILADQLQSLFIQPQDEIGRIVDLNYHLNMPEVTVITGVRRCGKSTLLKQIARRINKNEVHYINFEEQRLTRFSADDFQTAYEEFLLTAPPNSRKILIYDEIQLVDGWERWVAGLSARNDVKIFITGSNSKLLSSELSSLLTGRYRTLHITPLFFKEILPRFLPSNEHHQHSTEFKVALRRATEGYFRYGGFPRAFLGEDTAILGQYYSDILEKDIALRRKIRNIAALKNLGSVLASQNSRLFNQSSVARDLGVKSPLTIAKFCDYFQETYLYSELRLFSRSRRKQLRGRSKFYCVDPLMAGQVGFFSSTSLYWILENHVGNELLRRGFKLYYWHSKQGYEVDFIAQDKAGQLTAVQVAVELSQPETQTRETRALEAARTELGIKNTLIITYDELSHELTKKIPGPVLPFFRWAADDSIV